MCSLLPNSWVAQLFLPSYSCSGMTPVTWMKARNDRHLSWRHSQCIADSQALLHSEFEWCSAVQRWHHRFPAGYNFLQVLAADRYWSLHSWWAYTDHQNCDYRCVEDNDSQQHNFRSDSVWITDLNFRSHLPGCKHRHDLLTYPGF